MRDCYSLQQIQINLFMRTDHNNSRLQIIEDYYYSCSKGSLWKSFNSDTPVIRKIILLVLE